MEEESARRHPLALLQADEFFERNPFAYYIVRGGGAIVRVNTRFQEATGYSGEDLEGKQFEDLLSKGDVQELWGYHRAKLRYRDRTFEYECNVTRKDGADIRAVITMNVVVQGGFGLGALRDVTEERRLQRELEARNVELREGAARLRAAQEELSRVTVMATLGEVSGRVAHEILNPLTAISARVNRLGRALPDTGEMAGFVKEAAQQLPSTADGEAVATLFAVHDALSEFHRSSTEDLALVSSELGRIQRLVDDMRTATKATIARLPISLKELLGYCAEVMSSQVERAGVRYEMSCEDGITIHAERGELIQAITNLIRNAVEALEELPDSEARLIRITTLQIGETVEVRVSDSGPGLRGEIAPMIFEPNFSTKATGTGLGLAISRRLVRAHGGDLVLTTPALGRGATFLITLPCEVREGPS